MCQLAEASALVARAFNSSISAAKQMLCDAIQDSLAARTLTDCQKQAANVTRNCHYMHGRRQPGCASALANVSTCVVKEMERHESRDKQNYTANDLGPFAFVGELAALAQAEQTQLLRWKSFTCTETHLSTGT